MYFNAGDGCPLKLSKCKYPRVTIVFVQNHYVVCSNALIWLRRPYISLMKISRDCDSSTGFSFSKFELRSARFYSKNNISGSRFTRFFPCFSSKSAKSYSQKREFLKHWKLSRNLKESIQKWYHKILRLCRASLLIVSLSYSKIYRELLRLPFIS